MGKVPSRRFLCAGRVRSIHLGKRDVGLKRRVRIKHRLRVKIHQKARSSIVEKCKAPHSKDLLHGLECRSRLKMLVLDHMAAGEWGNREQHRAMCVHVVRAILRIIFQDEDHAVRPEAAVGNGFNDPTQGEIIVADHGTRRRIAGARPAGVVIR